MPSPDLLPKGRSFPTVVAPPLDDVLHRAKFRRVRRAGVIAGLAVVAIAGATLAFVPHGTSDSLHAVTPAVPNDTATPSPSGHVSSVGVVGHHATGTTATATHHASATTQTMSTTKHNGGRTASSPSLQIGPQSGDRGTTVRRTVGPPHRMTPYNPAHACNGTGPSPAMGWCSYYDGATSGKAGHAVTLATAVCRLPGQGGATLTSRSGRQTDFAIGKNAYPPVWSWAHGRKFDQSTSYIYVAAGTCVEWYVTWRVVDNAGQPLAPGSYYLDASTRMRPASAPAYAGAVSPSTFTVR